MIVILWIVVGLIGVGHRVLRENWEIKLFELIFLVIIGAILGPIVWISTEQLEKIGNSLNIVVRNKK